MKLIVALGNPTPKYAKTRHNVGFMALDFYINAHFGADSFRFKKKFNAEIFKHDGVIFAKPQTFMNASGESVSAIMRFYKVREVLVLHDDLDLPLGAVRFKFGGGNAGHNGLKSIDALCGREYLRIRIGIGRPVRASALGNISADSPNLGSLEKNSLDSHTFGKVLSSENCACASERAKIGQKSPLSEVREASSAIFADKTKPNSPSLAEGDLGGGLEKSKDSRESKNSSLRGNAEVIQGNLGESRKLIIKYCHFERSEKSKNLSESQNSKTPPPNPLPQGEGESNDSFGLPPTYFLEKSKQKNVNLGESDEISPTANPQSCANHNELRKSKSFLPTFFQKSRCRLGQCPANLNISPSPCRRGLGGGIESQSIESLQDSHESKNPLDFASLHSQLIFALQKPLRLSRHENPCGFSRNDSMGTHNSAFAKSHNDNKIANPHKSAKQNLAMTDSTTHHKATDSCESNKIFQLSPQNDKMLDSHKPSIADFVLSPFSNAEFEALNPSFEVIAKAISAFINGANLQDLQNKFTKKR